MKFFSLAVRYTFKNFLRLFPFVVVTAILFAFCYDFSALWKYLSSIEGSQSISFALLYASISLLVSQTWYLNIFAILSFILFSGCLLSMVDRHMRIGRFTYKFYRYILDVFKIALPVLAVCLAVCELIAFLVSGMAILFSLFIPLVAMKYIAIGFVAVGMIVFVLLISGATFWIPSVIVQGQRHSEGFSSSFRMSTKYFGSIFVAWLFPVLIWIILSVLSGIFLGHYAILCNIILNCTAMMYFVSLPMSAYFKVNEYERRDIKFRLFK